eukprot:364631-Chlamydomonas_euryale.AAC.4
MASGGLSTPRARKKLRPRLQCVCSPPPFPPPFSLHPPPLPSTCPKQATHDHVTCSACTRGLATAAARGSCAHLQCSRPKPDPTNPPLHAQLGGGGGAAKATSLWPFGGRGGGGGGAGRGDEAPHPRRILIMMSNTGGGHRASAEAIKSALVEKYGDAYEVRVRTWRHSGFEVLVFQVRGRGGWRRRVSIQCEKSQGTGGGRDWEVGGVDVFLGSVEKVRGQEAAGTGKWVAEKGGLCFKAYACKSATSS